MATKREARALLLAIRRLQLRVSVRLPRWFSHMADQNQAAQRQIADKPADGKKAESSPPSNLFLRRADQVAIAVLTLFALGSISAYWIWQAKLRGRLIDIDRSNRPSAAYSVDINTAEAPELIELPGLGQSLARRIVDWRKAHGRFSSIDQLRQISGIGPKRLESWRPYLRPIAPLGDQAALPPVGNPSQ